jgi:peptidyl-prolyl cis-trans isomerase SurA
MKPFVLLLVIALCSPFISWAQDEDPVLFSVDGKPVHESEFVYIYSKTNGKQANFSRKSLQEYLDLYVKFKLKVQKAKDMQLDTIPQLKNELAGYRRQLADSYLIDKEVTERLLREVYEHSKQDVDISHVMVAVPDNASEEVEAAAKAKVNDIMARLKGGADFETIAKAESADKSAQKNGGRIGYVTALFPNGFYELEKAAYTGAVGELQGPLRTSAGYHVLKVNARRPARGEIEAAHILLRTKGADEATIQKRIDSLYNALKGGADFEELAKQYSEDKKTNFKGGYIGFFGINKYSKPFEDAVFSLRNDGDITKPVKSSVGYHIIRRISLRGIQPYDIEKGRLENLVKKDARFEASKKAMVARIKSEAGLKEYPEVLEQFEQTLTDTFLTFRWKAPKVEGSTALFNLGSDYEATLSEFVDYLSRSSRKRIRMGRSSTVAEAVDVLYEDFLNENCMKYEEKQLEKKYPDFKSLMREYEEGILLFEATKMLVWDKASQDSVGLEAFSKKIEGKYRWKERAVTSIYKLQSNKKDQLDEIKAFVAEHSPEEVMLKYNTGEIPILRHESKTLERDIYPEFKNMDWKPGALSQSEEDPRSRSIKFVKIEEILPEGLKTLNEARGYIVADYQDYLEEKWVERLKKEYEVDIDQKVFEKLIQE